MEQKGVRRGWFLLTAKGWGVWPRSHLAPDFARKSGDGLFLRGEDGAAKVIPEGKNRSAYAISSVFHAHSHSCQHHSICGKRPSPQRRLN